jgi:hypothetical protein
VQHAASEAVPEHPETMALIIVQPEPPVAQLRLQDAILFAKKGDHIALLGLEPRQPRRPQHLERNHASTLPPRHPFQFSDSTGSRRLVSILGATAVGAAGSSVSVRRSRARAGGFGRVARLRVAHAAAVSLLAPPFSCASLLACCRVYRQQRLS